MLRYIPWIAVIIALFVIVGCSSKQDTPSTDKSNTKSTDSSSASVAGKDVFDQNCTVCHGTDGNKMPGWKGKVQKMSQAQVEIKVRDGGGGMPPFGKKLSDTQITDVATYTKQLAEK